jgi:hypothetical protein
MEIMDITYVVPPLVVAIAAPITEAHRLNGSTKRLLTLAVPKMYKRTVNASLNVMVRGNRII